MLMKQFNTTRRAAAPQQRQRRQRGKAGGRRTIEKGEWLPTREGGLTTRARSHMLQPQRKRPPLCHTCTAKWGKQRGGEGRARNHERWWFSAVEKRAAAADRGRDTHRFNHALGIRYLESKAPACMQMPRSGSGSSERSNHGRTESPRFFSKAANARTLEAHV